MFTPLGNLHRAALGIFRPCRGYPSSDIVRFHCLFEIAGLPIAHQMTNSPIPPPWIGIQRLSVRADWRGQKRDDGQRPLRTGAIRCGSVEGGGQIFATQSLASLIGALSDRVASYPNSHDCRSPRCTAAAPAGIQRRVPRCVRQRLGGDESPSVIASHQLPVKPDDANAKAASTVPPPPQVGAGQ